MTLKEFQKQWKCSDSEMRKLILHLQNIRTEELLETLTEGNKCQEY